MFKSKKLIIGALVTLALVVTSFTFAYWSNVALDDSVTENTVTIGEGRQATVTATFGTQGNGTLVPSGETGNSVSTSPTESIEYTFNVTWEDNAYTGDLSDVIISIDNISNATAATLLNFSINPASPAAITEGTPLTVTITVTLSAPANETEYNAIVNAGVTFDVIFTVNEPVA